MRVIVIVIACSVFAAAQPGVQLPPDVEALTGKVDPTHDDWTAEAAQAAAAAQLKLLATKLAMGDFEAAAALAVEGATASEWSRDDLAAYTLPDGVSARRRRTVVGPMPGVPVREALAAYLKPITASQERRIKFKIVGVWHTAGQPLQTRVRYEGYGVQLDGGYAVQQTGRWRVIWKKEKTDPAPRIAALEFLGFQETTRAAPLLTECTSTVLDLGGRDRDLARGGEYWFGRIDAVGESNLMGHHGLAVGDVNGDGRPDLYVAMGTGLPNRLLVQQTDGSVVDTAASAGVAWLDDTKGVLLADMDGDGDQDLLAAVANVIVLAKNDGSGRFGRLVSMRAPTPAPFYSLAAADYDGDGDLDIYGCRYVKVQYGISVPMPFHDANNGPTNHLLRNEGKDRFRDVTTRTGLHQNNSRFSLACTWVDFDQDGDPDLYVANDFGRNNLYRNDRGRFVDVAAQAGVEDQAAGMGISVADFDVDGRPDFYVTNMFSAAGNRIAYQDRFKRGEGDQRRQIQRLSLGNSLFRNLGGGRFQDVSDRAGVRMGRWGWGARFCDLNNDGYDDIVAPNGFLTGRLKDDL